VRSLIYNLQSRPRECVEEVAEWVVSERETRERLKKEKEEVSCDYVYGCTSSFLQKEKKEAEEAKKEAEDAKKKEVRTLRLSEG